MAELDSASHNPSRATSSPTVTSDRRPLHSRAPPDGSGHHGVACTNSIGEGVMELHLFGVTDKRELWHSIGHGEGRYDELGDVDRQTDSVPADRTIVDAACATDSKGNFHALVLADNGRLWYSVRSRDTGNWSRLKDLGEAQGPAANIGKINAVGAAADGMTLVVLAATEDKKLHRAVRTPDGPEIANGKWERPFEQIKPRSGPTPPPTAPFTVLVGAYSKTP